jgi:anti-sigma B factor antagonist
MGQADDFRAEIVAEEMATVIRLIGEIDIAVAPRLRAALDRASEQARPIVVDMERVGFIDSVGIAVLLVAANRARIAKGQFALRNPTPAAQRVLDILSLNGQLPVEHASEH